MDREDRLRAVDRAYREHAPDLYRVAYAILQDHDAAAEATQDAFARAFERWDRYDPARPLRTWLVAIVSRVALDAVRRRRVRLSARPVGAGSWPAGLRGRAIEAIDPAGDPAALSARRAVVEDAFDGLSPLARAALVLRHYHGYDYEEIAGFLRTSPGNVGSILSRAHASIRARLAETPPVASLPDAGGGRRRADSEVIR